MEIVHVDPFRSFAVLAPKLKTYIELDTCGREEEASRRLEYRL
jgi:hypothetical protein